MTQLKKYSHSSFTYQHNLNQIYLGVKYFIKQHAFNHTSDVMVGVFVSILADRGFEPRSGQRL